MIINLAMGKVTRVRIAYAAGDAFEEVTGVRIAQAAWAPTFEKVDKTIGGLLGSFDPALERLRSMALVRSSSSEAKNLARR